MPGPSLAGGQGGAENRIDIDTRQALLGLHLPPAKPAGDQAKATASGAQGPGQAGATDL